MGHKSNLSAGVLPEPGAAYAVPLADGRFGVCRAVETAPDDRVLVAATPFVGSRPPRPGDSDVGRTLELTHHDWDDEPAVLWVHGPPPAKFQHIGTAPRARNERPRNPSSSGDWDWFPFQILTQWRWGHDRTALLAEDDADELQETLQEQRQNKRHRRELKSMTLQRLRKKSGRFFSDWDPDYVGAENIAAARQIFAETIDELIALGSDAPRPRKLYRLKKSILRLNECDAREHFIDTVEWERLLRQFEEIACAAGWQPGDALADRWREW